MTCITQGRVKKQNQIKIYFLLINENTEIQKEDIAIITPKSSSLKVDVAIG
tara:strand:+ start:1138 stop:1290 length:153 start_codon:yes stop_codon:yes gene_type:complete